MFVSLGFGKSGGQIERKNLYKQTLNPTSKVYIVAVSGKINRRWETKLEVFSNLGWMER